VKRLLTFLSRESTSILDGLVCLVLQKRRTSALLGDDHAFRSRWMCLVSDLEYRKGASVWGRRNENVAPMTLAMMSTEFEFEANRGAGREPTGTPLILECQIT